MNSNSQASLEALDYQESLSDHIHDVSLIGALTAVAVVSAFMYRAPTLIALACAAVVGAILSAPWALHQLKKLGKDKPAANAVLRPLTTYGCLAVAGFAVLVRLARVTTESVLVFIN